MLRTLGQLTWYDPSTEQALLSAGKPLALLTYLACGNPSVTRDELAALLWDHLSPERARHSLRQALHSIRRGITPDPLDAGTNVVTLSRELATDRQTFLTAIHGGDAARAVATYRGRFLQGIAFPGAEQFERWRDLEAARLHRHWEDAGTGLVSQHLQRGQQADALTAAQALHALDGRSEAIHRALIEAYLALGQQKMARLEAEALVAWLREDGENPTRATAEILAQVHAGGGRTSSTTAGDPLAEPDLVGREAEFGTLTQAWMQAKGGQVVIVHVAGEAGIGKSRLLAALGDRLTGSRTTLIQCRAVSAERVHPYSFLTGFLERLADAPGTVGVDRASAETLVRLAPRLRERFPALSAPPDGHPTVAHVASALEDLLRSIADAQPTAVLLDDLHWSDTLSREVLGIVAGRLEGVAILLVTAARHELGLPGVSATSVRIGPLSEDAVAELIESVTDIEPEEVQELAGVLAGMAAGSPLLILDTLREAIRGAGGQLQSGRWQVGDREALLTACRAHSPVRSRLGALGSGQRRALEWLAVAGHPVPEAVMLDAESEPALAASDLHALELAGLVAMTSLGWDVGHDRYAEAVRDDLDAAQTRALHGHLAAALLTNTAVLDERRVVQALDHADEAGRSDLFPRIAHAWLQMHRPKRALVTARGYLQDLTTRAGRPHALPSLLRSLPWYDTLRAPHFLTMLVVLLGIAGIGSASLGGPSWRLVAAHEPLLGWSDPSRGESLAFLQPFAFTAVDQSGAIDSAAADRLTLQVVGGRAKLIGQPTVLLRNGTVRFDSVWISPHGDSTVRIDVRSGRLGVVSSKSFQTKQNQDGANLRLLGGLLNDQPIDPKHPRLVIPAGSVIAGELDLGFRTTWVAAGVVLCAVGSWETGPSATTTVSPLPTPVASGRIRREVRLMGPDTPGRYRLIFAARAEQGCHWISSLTNWDMGTPVWGDGNDLRNISDSELAIAKARGAVDLQMLSTKGLNPTMYGLQAVEVEVRR